MASIAVRSHIASRALVGGSIGAFIVVMMFGMPALSARAAEAEGQIDAGQLSRRQDLEIKSVYQADVNRTRVMLTLLPGGSALSMVFEAQFAGRSTAGTLIRLEVSAYAGPRSDPRRVRPGDLRFILDPDSRQGVTLYFMGSELGYVGFIPPGDEIPVARTMLSAPELRAIAAATDVRGEAIGYSFSLSEAQLKALGTFTDRVLPVDTASGATITSAAGGLETR
jgi:hypothetical protein